jgi:hypothetical protein
MFKKSKSSIGNIRSSGIQNLHDPKRKVDVFVRDNEKHPIQTQKPIEQQKKRRSKYQLDD